MYSLTSALDDAERLTASEAGCFLDRDSDGLIRHVHSLLMQRHGGARQDLLCLAMQAFAAHQAQAHGIEATLDLDNSTSHCLFLHSGGITHAVTISELWDILEHVSVRRLDARRPGDPRAGREAQRSIAGFCGTAGL